MQLELFADYFQFYLQDDDLALGNLADAWTDDAVQRLRIAVGPGVVGVATARNDTVAVELVVGGAAPPQELPSWQHVVEADLLCATGRIVVAGCSDFFPEARRLPVTPGRYRVRVSYGPGRPGTDGVGDEMAYRVEAWPSAVAAPPGILKQGPIPWQG